MKLFVSQTAEEASREAAAHIIGAMLYRCDECGIFSMAVGGGSAPPRVYAEMLANRRLSVALSKGVRIFWGDERSVPNDHEESNVRQAMEHFVIPAGIPAANVFAPNGAAENLEAEAQRYDEILHNNLPLSEDHMPVVDLNFLGMGPDGHTASLFPDTEALDENIDRAFVKNYVPQKETWRLTMTLGMLRASREILVVATGKAKAPVLAEIFQPGGSGGKYPIERLHREGTDMLWYVDEPAVSLFTPEQREAHGLPVQTPQG